MARTKGVKHQDAAPVDELDRLIDALLAERPKGKYGTSILGVELGDTKNGPIILALDRQSQAGLVDRLLDRLVEYDRRLSAMPGPSHWPPLPDWDEKSWYTLYDLLRISHLALRSLLKRKLPLTDDTLLKLLMTLTLNMDRLPLSGIVSAIENRAAEGTLGDALTVLVELAVPKLKAERNGPDDRKAADRLERLLTSQPAIHLEPGEAWSDAAIADLGTMGPEQHRAWSALLLSCQRAGDGKPTAKWVKAVRPLVDKVGRDQLRERLLHWFPLVDRPRTQPKARWHKLDPPDDDLIVPRHIDLLKGLAWCAALEADRDLARALTALALSSYRKVPGKGPRLVSLGNAAIVALGTMPGMDAVGQLAMLKVKVKSIPAGKQIEKALGLAAEREGLPREEVEELAVPSYGMDEVGRRREVLGDYVAELVVQGRDAALHWSKAADGKPLKSVPAAVKKEHADELKELQAAVKDAGKMLTVQRERIDGLFLSRKTWPFVAWRERYLDHPLVGSIARRLIWRFETGGSVVDGAWQDGRIVGADDQPLDGLGEGTTVRLWHPIGRTVEEVTAWRDWLDRHQVMQPFKQAHREVYVLAPAERNTRVYTNRFAGHVVRQHQYHALCAARGWQNRLRLMVDDTYPPTSKALPEWGLRAEFWVEGIGDDYGTSTTDSGTYLHLSTDQVRFYELGSVQRQAHAGGGGYSPNWTDGVDAEPLPMEQVPELVLSEVFRDVDLFVGVASVGNDPTWIDGGPGGHHIDYWNRASFGDLSANGQTRKGVLERLVPRLKIAPRCSFTEKFLVVKGDLRTYKIHLGSGNILMEPNDQYLCIVPKRGPGEAGGSPVFLPFEGDGTLSIILSKAMMLADDRTIDDPTIVNQIRK